MRWAENERPARGNDLLIALGKRRAGNGSGRANAGNGWRVAGATGHGDANSAAAIDSGLLCVRPLGALPTQMDIGQKTADILSTVRRKRTKIDAI
jgi:hypothetical protein